MTVSTRNPNAALVRADARRLPLADESVDLVVTSPPYWSMRSYTDGGSHFDEQIGSEASPVEYLNDLWNVTAECMRVLKPSGSMFVNLGDKRQMPPGHEGPAKRMREAAGQFNGRARRPDVTFVPWGSRMLLPQRYAIGCQDRGWIVRSEIIWAKPATLDTKATDRVMDSHEHWWHLVKQRPYFSNIDDIREPYADHTIYTAKLERDTGYERPRGNPNRVDGGRPKSNPHPLGRVPGSVWRVATEKVERPAHIDVEHFAPFPQEWPRRFILGWSPASGIVLDPFSGTGTTALVARALGRFGIGFDLSHDYMRLARWRIFQSGHGLKAQARTNRERQGSLLGAEVSA